MVTDPRADVAVVVIGGDPDRARPRTVDFAATLSGPTGADDIVEAPETLLERSA